MLFDPRYRETARRIRADSLEPVQQRTPRRFKSDTDFRQQWMLKHPHLSEFHSRTEHLHAALLEADPSVLAYVPQPFPLPARPVERWGTTSCRYCGCGSRIKPCR